MTDFPNGPGTSVEPYDDEADLVGVEDPGEDLDLVIAFLHKRLDPERVALVQKRLADDPDFRHMAAPLLWIWGAMPPDPEPVPRETIERHWDTFTKRAGFVHQRRKTMRRRLAVLGAVMLVLAVAAWFARDAIGAWYDDRFGYVTLDAAPGVWTQVGEQAEVRLLPGARLRVSRVPADTATDIVKLTGAAEFRVLRERHDLLAADLRPFHVLTRAGIVGVVRASFVVTTRGDTTFVDALVPDVPEKLGAFVSLTAVRLDNERGDAVVLWELQRGRIVKGQPPEVIP